MEQAERRRWKREGEQLRRLAETVAQAELRGRKDRSASRLFPQAETVEHGYGAVRMQQGHGFIAGYSLGSNHSCRKDKLLRRRKRFGQHAYA